MSACVELWHCHRAPDVPDEPLGGQFPPLSRILLKPMRVCEGAGELETHVCEVTMRGASKNGGSTRTAPGSYRQYVAVNVAVRAVELGELIKASEQHTQAKAPHRPELLLLRDNTVYGEAYSRETNSLRALYEEESVCLWDKQRLPLERRRKALLHFSKNEWLVCITCWTGPLSAFMCPQHSKQYCSHKEFACMINV